MYLLDTDILTHLHAGNSNVVERLKSVADIEVGITIITKVEILRGRIDYLLKAETGANLLKAQELLFRTEGLLNDLAIVPINQAASIEFDRLRNVSKFRKIRTGRFVDCQYHPRQSSYISNEKFTPF